MTRRVPVQPLGLLAVLAGAAAGLGAIGWLALAGLVTLARGCLEVLR